MQEFRDNLNDVVTLKLVSPMDEIKFVCFQLEVENQNLRLINQKQTKEMKTVQSKLQGKCTNLSTYGVLLSIPY